MLSKSSIFTDLLWHCADRGREVPLVTVGWMWKSMFPTRSLLTPWWGRSTSLLLGGGGSSDSPLSLHQYHPSWEEEECLITLPCAGSTDTMGGQFVTWPSLTLTQQGYWDALLGCPFPGPLARESRISFLFLKYLFIYFWLHWVFVAAHGLSLVAGATLRCGVQASHCSGFSCCRAWALGLLGFSSCGAQV